MTTQEFNTTVDLHADGLYRFILKHIKDEDKARDIVQDTYEKVWNKHEEVSFEKAKTYMFTTAYRTMIDSIRRDKKFDRNAEVEDLHIVHEKNFTDAKKILNRALATLPEIQRTVVMLRDYEGYSYDEIGKITELSEAQVKVYIYRARIALKEYIGKIENII